MEQNVAASEEHAIDQGRPVHVVRDWYETVLHRSPSSGQEGYWVSRLDSRVPTLAVFREPWCTPGAVQGRIQGHYGQLPERGPALVSPGELAYRYGR